MKQAEQKGHIGGEIRRLDAFDKVTGQAIYVEDIQIPSLLQGGVLRSPYHHARLLALDTRIASQMEGVERVITAADIPGENGFPEYSRDEPVLTPVGEHLRMRGAPLALVVARDAASLQRGLRAIQVQYEPLPHHFTLSEQPGWLTDQENEQRLEHHHVLQGNIQATLATSALVIESQYHSAYQEHAALERESMLAYIDQAGRLTVLGGTHEPHWQRKWIAATLGLPIEQVRFITPPTGGSFGGKQDPWPLIATGLMAHLTGQPVRLVYSRPESFQASPKRHPYDMYFVLGADHEGRLTGIQARIQANTGGYDSAGYYIPEYAVFAAGGPYRWQAADIYAQALYTNGPKSGQFRGFGTPQSTFGLECSLDELCQHLQIDPIAFRLQNQIMQSENTFLGYPVAESFGYQQVLEAMQPYYRQAQARVEAFNAASLAPDSPHAHLRAGVGVAGMWYRFGKSGSLRIEAQAELDLQGKIIIYCSAPEYGQGIATVMLQLAAETLGLPRHQLRLVNADTALCPDSDVQGASRATYWIGNAVNQAARNLQTEILGVAAEMLDCHPDLLQLTGEQVRSLEQDGPEITLAEVAQEFEHLGKSRRLSGFFDQSPLFPEKTRPGYTPHIVTGAHLAEVQVDLETGQVRVERFVAVHDVGRVINRLGAEGQVEGAVVMGLGSALYEAYLPGQTTGFSDYILPLVDEIPEIEVVLVEVPAFHGPFGAKGLGETAMLASTPAIINALSRALGVRIRQIPATPERVLAALQR